MSKHRTEPCDNCPFRTQTTVRLRTDRAEEIADALRMDGNFDCHKTLDYSDGEGRRTPSTCDCAGAQIAAIRDGCGPTQMARIAGRLGLLDVDQLYEHAEDPDNSVGVVADLDDFVEMHRNKDNRP